MNSESMLIDRSGGQCELCGSPELLQVYQVPPQQTAFDAGIVVCKVCTDQITKLVPMDHNHWRCLNSSMWSTVPAVQVMAWRILTSVREAGWPQDLLDMLYLDDETLAWAKSTEESEPNSEPQVIHKDSNGNVLQAGDSVVLIKDLDVKGANFTAKRGTVVRSITLVENNAAQIEGRVSGQQIVILTQYVKKST